MKDKILNQLVNKCIDDCYHEIDIINNNSNKSNLNYKRKIVNKLKNNINSIIMIKNEDIKDILDDLEYNDIEERIRIENELIDIKKSLFINNKITDYQYKVIYKFYDMIDNYELNINKDNIKALDTLNDLLNKFNDFYKEINDNDNYINNMEVLNLVFEYNKVNYKDRINILTNIMKNNERLFL